MIKRKEKSLVEFVFRRVMCKCLVMNKVRSGRYWEG